MHDRVVGCTIESNQSRHVCACRGRRGGQGSRTVRSSFFSRVGGRKEDSSRRIARSLARTRCLLACLLPVELLDGLVVPRRRLLRRLRLVCCLFCFF